MILNLSRTSNHCWKCAGPKPIIIDWLQVMPGAPTAFWTIGAVLSLAGMWNVPFRRLMNKTWTKQCARSQNKLPHFRTPYHRPCFCSTAAGMAGVCVVFPGTDRELQPWRSISGDLNEFRDCAEILCLKVEHFLFYSKLSLLQTISGFFNYKQTSTIANDSNFICSQPNEETRKMRVPL